MAALASARMKLSAESLGGMGRAEGGRGKSGIGGDIHRGRSGFGKEARGGRGRRAGMLCRNCKISCRTRSSDLCIHVPGVPKDYNHYLPIFFDGIREKEELRTCCMQTMAVS